MLDLVFGRHLAYVVLIVLVSTAVLAVVGACLRKRSDRPWTYAAWAASTTATLCLTLWTKTVATGSLTCTVSKDVLEPFGVAQGWMNTALFVPVGFFGLRSVRRPVLPLLLAVLLSSGIETVQAVVPDIGRYCDTSDLISNVTGATAGVGLGLLSVRLLGGRLLSPGRMRHDRRHAVTYAAVAGFAAAACLLATTVEFRVVDHAEPSQTATAEQRRAMVDVVRQTLGNGVRVTEVTELEPCGLDGVDEMVWAGLEPRGTVSMPWPDHSSIQMDLWGRLTPEGLPAGYRIPGAVGPVTSAAAAQRAANRYVAAHYPAAVRGARPEVTRADEGFGTTWTLAYPLHDKHLPDMKLLRVTLNTKGRLLSVHLTVAPPEAEGTSDEQKSAGGGGMCP